MKTPLLDVNALVALAWPNHEHHEIVSDWFELHHESGWATCPVSQSSFVRISSNRKAVYPAQTPNQALGLLRQLTRLPGHEFWNDELSFSESDFVRTAHLQGYRQVSDLHLLALAAHHEGVLLTLDGKIQDLVPTPWRNERLIVHLS